MAGLLRQDQELQDLLSDALMRSEHHRENYTRSLKLFNHYVVVFSSFLCVLI